MGPPMVEHAHIYSNKTFQAEINDSHRLLFQFSLFLLYYPGILT
jgi:hypothetical protein